MWAYTDTDKAGVVLSGNSRYEFYEAAANVKRTALFTDRSIYRPGQTVHASALVYQVKHGTEQSVCPKQAVTFVLRDANHKVVGEKKANTDEMGSMASFSSRLRVLGTYTLMFTTKSPLPRP